MGMVAPEQRIASAFFVVFGKYGDVTRYAQERGVCRQSIYNEAATLRNALATAQQENDRLCGQLRQADEQRAELEARLAQAVVIDARKQEQLAFVGQARDVTLRDCFELLEVLIPGQTLSVAELGRRTKAAGKKAGELLAVLDEVARTNALDRGSPARESRRASATPGRRRSSPWTPGRNASGFGTRSSTRCNWFRWAYRASSLVECINSVLRMHQAGHRRMTQGLLDLKRLYWNCHTFSAGRRRQTTPYERLGVATGLALVENAQINT